MSSPSQETRPKPTIGTQARQFWQRVSEGMEVHQLWSQFEKDARSSYRL